jgi:phosphate transport system substrate-binding protein
MNSKLRASLMVVVLLSVLLAACNTPAPATTMPAPTQVVATEIAPVEPTAEPTAAPVQEGLLPEIDPSTVEGDIYAAGSSTVYPLMEAVVGLFEEEGYTGQVKIDSIGSGAGFDRFCKTGETDIANASRAAKDSDKENCIAIGRNLVEFRVGTDAIAVVVSKENDFLTNVTAEELAKIFTSESVLWSDVNASWPAEPILRFTPGTDSGTFEFFVETAIQKPRGIETLDDAKKLVLEAANLQLSEDDNVLVQGVEGSKYAIGYFGYAYFTNASDKLTALSVEGVAPSFETAESGEYMLSRPLFIYSDAQIMKDKPQVASLIAFFLNRVNDVIGQVGYFPASEEALTEAKQNWLDATK